MARELSRKARAALWLEFGANDLAKAIALSPVAPRAKRVVSVVFDWATVVAEQSFSVTTSDARLSVVASAFHFEFHIHLDHNLGNPYANTRILPHTTRNLRDQENAGVFELNCINDVG